MLYVYLIYVLTIRIQYYLFKIGTVKLEEYAVEEQAAEDQEVE